MEVFEKIYHTLSSLKWRIIFWKLYLTSSGFRLMIKHNKSLKNSSNKERCFIVGNGPSLNSLDLTKLYHENVFTVNFLVKNELIFEQLNPDYHVVIDPYFGTMSDSDFKDFYNQLEKLAPNIKLICSDIIYLKRACESVKDNLFGLFLHDNWNRFGKKVPNLERNSCGSLNVVLTAILVAMYIGYKKIILIGCDMTAIYDNFDFNGSKKNINIHAYDDTQIREAREKGELKVEDNYTILVEYSRVFRAFKDFLNFSKNHSIEILNATGQGILDVFEQVDYNKLFNE